MAGSGPTRERLAGVLNAGDLTFRAAGHSLTDLVRRTVKSVAEILRADRRRAERLLTLDWNGAGDELTIGRDPGCDVVLSGPTVSRRHARLCFRDGARIVQDLESTNGTLVNHRRVVRCRVIPGDRLDLGGERLTVD